MRTTFDVIIVDMSNVYHRSYATSSNLTSVVEGQEIVTGGTLTSFRSIKNYLKMLNEDGKLYLAYDSPTKTISDDSLSDYSNYRKQVDPDYKNHREPKPPEFYVGLTVLKSILLNYGDNLITAEIEGLEADDLVPAIIEKEKGKTVLMISGDLDWARDITDNVHWLNHQKEIHDRNTFFDKYQFYPEKLEMQKSFRGDTSDGIPIAVKGIRTDVLNVILSKYNTISDMRRKIEREEFLSDTWKTRIIENYGRIKLNAELVKAIPVEVSVLDKYLIPSKFSPNKLRTFYRTLGFNISKVDGRLLGYFPEDKPTAKNFFTKEKLPR